MKRYAISAGQSITLNGGSVFTLNVAPYPVNLHFTYTNGENATLENVLQGTKLTPENKFSSVRVEAVKAGVYYFANYNGDIQLPDQSVKSDETGGIYKQCFVGYNIDAPVGGFAQIYLFNQPNSKYEVLVNSLFIGASSGKVNLASLNATQYAALAISGIIGFLNKDDIFSSTSPAEIDLCLDATATKQGSQISSVATDTAGTPTKIDLGDKPFIIQENTGIGVADLTTNSDITVGFDLTLRPLI